MDAGRFPGGISLPEVPQAEPQNCQSLPAIKAPMHQRASAGNFLVRSGSRPPSTGRDEANNPLYWRFAHTARGFTTCQKLGLGRIC